MRMGAWRRRLRRVPWLVALLGVLAGCGGDNSPRSNGLLACIPLVRSVAAVPSGEAWVVGTGFTGGDLDFRGHCTDTLRYHNGAWAQVPAPSDTHFVSIYAVAPGDVWAGADNGAGFYHFDGTQWNHDPFAVPPGSFSGANQAIRAIAMLSGSEGWALTDNKTGNVLHYSGGKWQVAATLDAPDLTGTYSALDSLAMTSPTNGWAVGYHYIAHYDGNTWQVVDSPVAQRKDVELTSVAMVSADEGWAVGALTDANDPNRTSGPSPISGLILRYSGGKWSIADTPATALNAVAMVSPSEGWAAGAGLNGGPALLHYAQGTWTPLRDGPTSTTLLGMAMSSPAEGWAVANDTIYHYQNGAWSVAHQRGPREPGPP